MNIPEVSSYEHHAIDTVVSILNKAQEKLGFRQTLKQLAKSRYDLANQAKLTLTCLGPPLAITSQTFISEAIEKKWKLTDTLMYTLRYRGGSQDECSQYYYYEAIFSQPTISYPIPQTTASVFFRVEDKHIEPPEIRGVPMMTFRIEGHHHDHDVRYVLLTADWILAVMKMKLNLFRRIESLKIF